MEFIPVFPDVYCELSTVLLEETIAFDGFKRIVDIKDQIYVVLFAFGGK